MPRLRRPLIAGPVTRAGFFSAALVLVGILLTALLADRQQTERSIAPHPSLAPVDVVAIQLTALRSNSPRNEGIAAAYRFASANNRRNPRPLLLFANMLQSESYRSLLNHLSVEYGPVIREASRSLVPVVVTDRYGASSAYIWVLSQSTANRCRSCWMTDAVIPAGELHQLRFA